MAKTKRRRSRTRVSKGSALGRAQKTRLPLDTYAEWLKRQTVKPAITKIGVQVPLDSYEQWIRRRVKERLEAMSGY